MTKPLGRSMAPIVRKLRPERFTAMSGKMAAIVAFILDMRWTHPAIAELIVTSDGMVLARNEGDIGANEFIGSVEDLVRNWTNLLDAAELTPGERRRAVLQFNLRVRRA